MQLGDIIRSFSEDAAASEALLACNDIVLFARVGEAATRFEETVGRGRQALCQSRRQRGLARPDECRRAYRRSWHGLPHLHGQLVAEER